MNVLIYSKPSCVKCVQAKMLLSYRGITFTENVIGEDIIREDFVSLFPSAQSVPFIIIDGMQIGGYEQLREYFDNQPQFIQD